MVSIKNGTFDCDLTLSNMPHLADYYIRLNAGMNIRYIRNAEESMAPLQYERSQYDSFSSGESLAYFIPAINKSGKYLPAAVRFNYVGKYPVITDSISVVDWRGNLAFNGQSVRADGIQSAWTPILYDVKNDKRYDQVTYDLDITCNDCKVIYVNGTEPVSGTKAHVVAKTAQDLTMFAGDFKSVAINGSYFLNPDVNSEQLTEIEKTLHGYQDYLANNLSIPYKGEAVYIQTTPVSKHNAWLFASYPTIVKIGWDDGMKSFFDKNEAAGFRQFMSHELAHYYFGKVRTFNSELGGMISEGFAEFLSLKIARKFISDSFYNERVRSKIKALQNFKPIPVAEVYSANDYRNRELYVYYYAPMLFSGIEKEIGEDKMWAWMRALLLDPAVFTNYAFLKASLHKVLADKTKADVLMEKYFSSAQGLKNAVSALNLPNDESSAPNGSTEERKTYYYFCFTKPYVDPGSSQNKVIKHTDIKEVTCKPSELSAISAPIFKKLADACENEGGCTSDFNTYYSMEDAQAALKRWLKRYNSKGTLEVKVFKL